MAIKPVAVSPTIVMIAKNLLDKELLSPKDFIKLRKGDDHIEYFASDVYQILGEA